MPLRILLAAMALLLVPATASADSIVFVKDANVWVASPDGANQRPLTRDGTADQPYRSPRRPTTAPSRPRTATASGSSAAVEMSYASLIRRR